VDTPWLDLDLHRLELRFAGARLVEPRAVERIARSIEQGGQIVPCVAVAESPTVPNKRLSDAAAPDPPTHSPNCCGRLKIEDLLPVQPDISRRRG
jgi:hypothetical protein